MKRIISMILLLAILVTVSGCGGSFAQVNLRDPVDIPENGVIEKELLEKLKSENAIGVFRGTSCDYKYEWTIFGSDLAEVRDVNLKVEIHPSQKRIGLTF